MKKMVRESLNEKRIEKPKGIKSIGKTEKILQFIGDAGPEGVRYIDIIKLAYELTNGEGSYTNDKRGYWSGAFKTPSKDDFNIGHLIKYIKKNEKGRWVLRDERMTPDIERKYNDQASYGGYDGRKARY